MLSSNPLVEPIVLDNGDPEAVLAGTWSELTAEAYGNDLARLGAGESGSASWIFDDLQPGYRYRVSATWQSTEGSSTDAMYRITDILNGDVQKALDTIALNQSVGPDDFIADGVAWEDLGGEVLVRGTTLEITLQGDVDGVVTADAIRLERLGEWQAPVGTAAPEFGIEESHWMYANPAYTYDFGNGPEAYRMSEAGPYTHYVDGGHAHATDVDNPFGTVDRPRVTIPKGLAAGSVVEVHGSLTYKNAYGNWLELSGQGTAERPVFIRGTGMDAKAVFANSAVMVRGSYMVLEYLHTQAGVMYVKNPTDHVSIRHSECSDFPVLPEGSGMTSLWMVQAVSESMGGNAYTAFNDQIVYYNNHIHNNGPWPAAYETGNHGIMVQGNARDIWIVDNHIEYNAEDGIQIYYNAGNSAYIAEDLSISRNIIHHNSENAIDIKQSKNVVVSENIAYGYLPTDYPSSGSDGTAIVLEDDRPHENLWVIANEVFDSAHAVRAQESGYIIGNVFHDIHHMPGIAYDPTDLWASGSAIIGWGAPSVHIIGNTMYDVDSGINYAGGGEQYMHVANNIIADISQPLGFHVGSNYGPNLMSEIHDNLFWQSGGNVRLNWGNRMVTVEELAAMGHLDNFIADPMFLDPASGDFRLADGSPALSVGNQSTMDYYAGLFYSLYGRDIGLDMFGTVRPQNGGLDLGAIEDGYGVIDPNTRPVVNDLATETLEDTVLHGRVSGTDADGDAMTFAIVAQPGHGSVAMSADGAFVYTPAADYFGADSFTVRAFDGRSYSNTAVVSIDVLPTADAPIATDDALVTTVDKPVTMDLTANDIDVDGDVLSIGELAQPTYGQAVLNADGTVTYTPAADFRGADSFSYTVSDGQSTDVATVTVSVDMWQSGDIGSVAVSGGTTYDDASDVYVVSGSGADIGGQADAFHFAWQHMTGDGVLVARVASVTNTHDWAKAGLMFRESLSADAANVLMGLTSQMGTTLQSRATTGGTTSYNDPLDGAAAPYWIRLERVGDTFTGSRSADGTNWDVLGSVTVALPETAYVGLAVSSLNDGTVCAAAFENVAVGSEQAIPLNTAPVASDDTATTQEDQAVVIDVLANDSDVDGDALSVAGLGQPVHGSVVDNGDGTVTYTPGDGFSGSESFTYVLTDGELTAEASVTVTVQAVDELTWQGVDIGAVAVPGACVDDPATGTCYVSGSGANIADRADEFFYAYQELAGDGVIIARVNGMTDTHDGAKAGLMFRESLTDNSRNVLMALTPQMGSAMQWRLREGLKTRFKDPEDGAAAPCWLKLERAGDEFTGYCSTDGVDWDRVMTVKIGMSQTAYVGLAVSSLADGTLCTAAFSDLYLGEAPYVENVAPIAQDDAGISIGGWSIPVDVLANDRDADGDALSVVNVGSPMHGTAKYDGNGIITYTPTPGYTGVDGFTYTIADGNGETSYANVHMDVHAWLNGDIGEVAASGQTEYELTGPIAVSGSGGDIASTADEFQYAYQAFTGDGAIVARVDAVGDTHDWAKAGLMFRESLSADSANVLMALTSQMGSTMQWRSATGGQTSYNDPLDGATAPYWLKLERVGDTFTGYRSLDGETWDVLDSVTIDMSQTVYVGMAVSSLNDGVVCDAVFDEVSLAPGLATLL